MAIRVAVDAMGGDQAPAVIIDGALRALREAGDDLELLLFGPEQRLRDELARHEAHEGLPLRVVDAPDVIGMSEAPTVAVKTKPRSSIHLGLAAHKEGRADAFVSAGNTGAIMAASLFILGRVPGVARPSVIAFFPTTEGVCIVLDVGTNVDCRPEHLLQFARMGSIYARHVLEIPQPTVALLNVGEEPGKGTDPVKEAYRLLEDAPDLHFRGNVEGRDIMHHAADVVVCDGFVGNVLLKFGESMTTAVAHMFKQEAESLGLTPDQHRAAMDVLRAVRRRFDYEEYGGAPLLGVNGNVLIGHGSSTVVAVERMMRTAANIAAHHLARAMAEAFAHRPA